MYEIGWLAVWRGVARALAEHACGLVIPPAEVIVTTFAPSDLGGEPACRFYERMGFTQAGLLPGAGPTGETRQHYRKMITAR